MPDVEEKLTNYIQLFTHLKQVAIVKYLKLYLNSILNLQDFNFKQLEIEGEALLFINKLMIDMVSFIFISINYLYLIYLKISLQL